MVLHITLPPGKPKLEAMPKKIQLYQNTEATLKVMNTGDVPLKWKASTNSDWLQIMPKSGTLEPSKDGQLILSVSDQTKPKERKASLTISGDEVSPVPINVELCIPELSVSPQSIQLDDENQEAKLTISNSGNAPINWTVSHNTSWMIVVPVQEHFMRELNFR